MLAGSVMLALLATPLRQRPSSPVSLLLAVAAFFYVKRFDARVHEHLIYGCRLRAGRR